MKLSELNEGGAARILKVNGCGATRQRLLDMGLVKGAELSVVRYAPLEDPVQISIKGYSLALRVSECDLIEVEPLACGNPDGCRQQVCGRWRRRWGFMPGRGRRDA